MRETGLSHNSLADETSRKTYRFTVVGRIIFADSPAHRRLFETDLPERVLARFLQLAQFFAAHFNKFADVLLGSFGIRYPVFFHYRPLMR